MKTIPLTRGRVAIVDDLDYYFLVQIGRWHVHVSQKSKVLYARHTVRLAATGGYFCFFMHTLVAQRAGLDISRTIDHKDLDGLHNVRDNLRPASLGEQRGNLAMQSNNTSGYRGVTYSKSGRRWVASIRINTKLHELGRFATREEAAEVYRAAAIKNFGEFYRDLTATDTEE